MDLLIWHFALHFALLSHLFLKNHLMDDHFFMSWKPWWRLIPHFKNQTSWCAEGSKDPADAGLCRCDGRGVQMECNHDYVYTHGGSFESLLDFHGPKQNRSSFNRYRPMVTLRKEDSDLYGIEISLGNGLLAYLHIHLQFMSWENWDFPLPLGGSTN